MTAQATMQNAIEAMRRGAYDYITKPFDLEEVNVLVQKALDVRRLSLEAEFLRDEVRDKYDGGIRQHACHAGDLQDDREGSGKRCDRTDTW